MTRRRPRSRPAPDDEETDSSQISTSSDDRTGQLSLGELSLKDLLGFDPLVALDKACKAANDIIIQSQGGAP